MIRRVIVLAVAAVALAACSDGSGGTDPAPDAGSVVAGGGSDSLGSCAFEFSPETLAERDFAFDGTVAQIREPASEGGPYEVVFEVGQWYRGAGAPTVTLRTYDVSGTSLAGDLGLAEGQRILASGDDDFLWGCGFSMPYTAQDADLFADAFAS